MELNEFSVGSTYKMTVVPYLDCEPGEETVKILTVLSPATADNSLVDNGVASERPSDRLLAEWNTFLRVRDEAGRVRLQPPTLVTSAERLR